MKNKVSDSANTFISIIAGMITIVSALVTLIIPYISSITLGIKEEAPLALIEAISVVNNANDAWSRILIALISGCLTVIVGLGIIHGLSFGFILFILGPLAVFFQFAAMYIMPCLSVILNNNTLTFQWITGISMAVVAYAFWHNFKKRYLINNEEELTFLIILKYLIVAVFWIIPMVFCFFVVWIKKYYLSPYLKTFFFSVLLSSFLISMSMISFWDKDNKDKIEKYAVGEFAFLLIIVYGVLFYNLREYMYFIPVI